MKLSTSIEVILTTAILYFATFTANASEFEDTLLDIQHDWAKANYSLEGKQQEAAFEELIVKSKQFIEGNPDLAEPLVWHGIIQSSYAGVRGGLGALSHAKAAKKSFESALKLDDSVLEGSAYTSLGVLYHKVPGWPIAFGDDGKARKLLEKAINLNPNGIDPNYFYAEYLYDKKKYDEAKMHLKKALAAPTRDARPLADKSRRMEVEALLAQVEKKLGKNNS